MTGMPFCRSCASRAIPGIEVVSSGPVCAHHRDRRRPRHAGRRTGRRTTASRSTVRFPDLKSLPAIIARVRRVFDLAADPVAIGAHLSQDPLLAPLVAARPGPAGSRRVGRIRTRGARHSWAADHRVGGDEARRQAGCAVRRESRRSRRARSGADACVSHAAAIGRVPIWRRSACRRPGGTALSSLAAAVVADPVIFGPRRSLEEAIAQLRSLAGIGEWTAQYIAMRELREPDAFPAADIGLLRAMRDREGVRPHPPNCSRTPSDGDPGAPMPRCISGRPKRTHPRQLKRCSMTSKLPERLRPGPAGNADRRSADRHR